MPYKIIVAEIDYDSLGSFHISRDDFKSYNLKLLFEEATNDELDMKESEGAKVTITFKYMDKQQYDKLPEFNGF